MPQSTEVSEHRRTTHIADFHDTHAWCRRQGALKVGHPKTKTIAVYHRTSEELRDARKRNYQKRKSRVYVANQPSPLRPATAGRSVDGGMER